MKPLKCFGYANFAVDIKNSSHVWTSTAGITSIMDAYTYIYINLLSTDMVQWVLMTLGLPWAKHPLLELIAQWQLTGAHISGYGLLQLTMQMHTATPYNLCSMCIRSSCFLSHRVASWWPDSSVACASCTCAYTTIFCLLGSAWDLSSALTSRWRGDRVEGGRGGGEEWGREE